MKCMTCLCYWFILFKSLEDTEKFCTNKRDLSSNETIRVVSLNHFLSASRSNLTTETNTVSVCLWQLFYIKLCDEQFIERGSRTSGGLRSRLKNEWLNMNRLIWVMRRTIFIIIQLMFSFCLSVLKLSLRVVKSS